MLIQTFLGEHNATDQTRDLLPLTVENHSSSGQVCPRVVRYGW